MKIVAMAFLLLSCPPVLAKAPCKESNWAFVGNLSKTIRTYDALFKADKKTKPNFSEFNSYLKQSGLLQVLSPVGEIKGFPNRLERDGIGGLDIGAFLKKLKVPTESGLSLDRIYEVEDVNASRALRYWHLPYGSNGPEGLEGDDLYYKDVLAGVCVQASFESVIKVRLDGTYELVDFDLAKEVKTIPPDRCKAAKALFKDSAYATCGETIDRKTKKKRILVWEYPMT